MHIHIYAKNTEDISIFEEVIHLIREEDTLIDITIENRRSFRELEEVKESYNHEDVLLIGDLPSLGLNEAEIALQLEWFITMSRTLVIASFTSTYEYGVSQPLNKAILTTILQTVLKKKKIVEVPRSRKANSGRNKLAFPDNWDELYEQWENKEITSKDFLDASGLKKATFYNMITEYKRMLSLNEEYIKKYKIG